MFTIIQCFLLRPKYAFTQLKEFPLSAWYPFLSLLSMVCLFWFAYYGYVDNEWLREYTITRMTENLSPAEQDNMRQLMPSAENLKFNAILGSGIVLILQGAVIAAILNLLTKLDEENTDTFKDWLGQVWWTQLPMLPQLVLSLLVMLIMGNEQALHPDLIITSLNQLIGLSEGDAFYTFFAGFDIFSLWSYLLLFYLISARTKLSTHLCITITVTPILTELAISYALG